MWSGYACRKVRPNCTIATREEAREGNTEKRTPIARGGPRELTPRLMHASQACWLVLVHIDDMFLKPPGLASIQVHQHQCYYVCLLELSDLSALDALGPAPTAKDVEALLARTTTKIDEVDVEADSLEEMLVDDCLQQTNISMVDVGTRARLGVPLSCTALSLSRCRTDLCVSCLTAARTNLAGRGHTHCALTTKARVVLNRSSSTRSRRLSIDERRSGCCGALRIVESWHFVRRPQGARQRSSW